MIQLGFGWCFPDVDPATGLARLRDAGFEGVELWPDALKQHGIGRWAAAVRVAGMQCFQLCPYFNFMHGPEKVAASRQMLDEYLGYARQLGCRRLRVFTGPPWGEGVVGARQATEAQWQTASAELQRFCDVAGKEGVELCLECHEGSLMEESVSALRLLRAVNRPNLTTNLQLLLLNEDWQTSVRNLAPYTTHIHIHNWTKPVTKFEGAELTFLDAGIFDWRPVLRQLPRDLCLSVEHASHGGQHDPWETARRDGAFLQALRV
jgi:sugar phosphate isomerase/epimerase